MTVNGELVQVLSSGSHMCLSDNDFVKAAENGTGKQLSGYWSRYLFGFAWFSLFTPLQAKFSVQYQQAPICREAVWEMFIELQL